MTSIFKTPADALSQAVIENGRSPEYWPYQAFSEAVTRIDLKRPDEWAKEAAKVLGNEGERRAANMGAATITNHK
jgi:hypothetical protein